MTDTRYSIIAFGPPKVGKSHFAGTICEVMPPKEVCLLVAKPGEEKTDTYTQHGLNERAELFYDTRWRPAIGSYEANAYSKLMKRLMELLKDEQFGAVIVDPGTDVAEAAKHHLLAPHGVASPGDLRNTMNFYGQYYDYMKQFVELARDLSSAKVAARPKHVIIPWHVQAPREGDEDKRTGEKKETADEKAQGVQYLGEVLPQLSGSYKYNLAADVDFQIFAHAEARQPTNEEYREGKRGEQIEYFLQVRPSGKRYAGLRGVPTLAKNQIPNSFPALLAAIEEAKEAADASTD